MKREGQGIGVTAGQSDGDILPCGLGIIGVPGPGGPVLETGGPCNENAGF